MASSATSPPPTKPVVLAQRYRLDRRLAQGGMAEVWLAFDLHLTRPVAVKVLKAALAVDPVVTERFRREAIAVAQLSHPNIVTVYDAISEGGRQAVVMQLVNGKSLRQLLDEQKRLSPDLTIHIGSCVASALDAAHQAGLVHRDVKPGNILITPDGRVLLTDFGIAKELQPSGEDLTNDNIMMGTAKYLSPEQVRGRRLDGRADLYSLGLVLYECLAGRVPFLGGNDVETALARLQRAPTDITTLRPTLPYGLAELIHRLLARRPNERYESGSALRLALAEVAERAKHPVVDPLLDNTFGDTTGTPIRRPQSAPVPTPTPPAPRATPPAPKATPAPTPTPPAPTATPAPLATSTPPAPVATSAPTPARVSSPAAATPRAGTPAPGYQAVRAAGRPAGAPVRSDRTPLSTSVGTPAGTPAGTHVGPSRDDRGRDRTPPSPHRPEPRPNRQYEQRHGASLVILAVVLATSVLLGVILWHRLDADDTAAGEPGTASSIAAPDAPAGSTPDGSTTTVGLVTAPTLSAAVVFDPDGDGVENDDLAAFAIDGNPSTAWTTVCYASQYLGGKVGVGLAVSLAAPARGTLVVEVGTGPFNVDVFSSVAGAPPATMAEWGERIASDASAAPRSVTVPVVAEGQHFLVLFHEIAPSTQCSGDNPYRGVINDVHFRASA